MESRVHQDDAALMLAAIARHRVEGGGARRAVEPPVRRTRVAAATARSICRTACDGAVTEPPFVHGGNR